MSLLLSPERAAYVDASARLAKQSEALAGQALAQLLVDLMDIHEQTELEDAIVAAHDALLARLPEASE